jgi:hypothetical protein
MANVPSNRISVTISDTEMQTIHSAVQALQETLLPKLVDLDAEERRTLPKMGAKTVDFVTKAFEYTRANPQFKPVFVDIDEFERDLAGVALLRSLQQPLNQLADLVDDSLMLSGSEAYAAALACYQSLRAAAKLGHPGAAVVFEDLAARFVARNAKAAAPAAAMGGGHPRPVSGV